jgi:hypothetical protein
MLRRVALVRTDVSEEISASFIRVTRISELGTTLAVTSNRRTLRRNVGCYLELALFLVHRFLSPWWRWRYVPPKRRFLQEPHGVISENSPFFIVTTVNISNLTYKCLVRNSHQTHYLHATEPSRLWLRKIWGFRCGDYEECRLLLRDVIWPLSEPTLAVTGYYQLFLSRRFLSPW